MHNDFSIWHNFLGISITGWKWILICLTLKGCRLSIYNQIHITYRPHHVQKSYVIYLWVWYLLVHIALCQGANKTHSHFNIGDQKTTVVFASKGTQTVQLNLNLKYHQKIQPIWKVQLMMKKKISREDRFWHNLSKLKVCRSNTLIWASQTFKG